MRVLVTGGAGFIGSNLVDRLLVEEHDVDVVDDLSTGTLANLADSRAEMASRSSGAGQLKIHQLDVLDDGFATIVARRRPDCIVHLAGDTWRRSRSPRRQLSIDLASLVAVIESAVAHEVGRIVWVASARSQADPVRAIPDRAGVEYLRTARAEGGPTPCTLVLPTVYGPRQTPATESSVVATFVQRMVAGEQCVVHGGGQQTRDLLFVDDAVDGLVRALHAGDDAVVDLGSGQPVTIAELHDRVAAACGTERPAAPAPARDREPGDVDVDPTDAASVLGWRPFTDLDEGLRRTVAAARD